MKNKVVENKIVRPNKPKRGKEKKRETQNFSQHERNA
jgi:hypothetical protein